MPSQKKELGCRAVLSSVKCKCCLCNDLCSHSRHEPCGVRMRPALRIAGVPWLFLAAQRPGPVAQPRWWLVVAGCSYAELGLVGTWYLFFLHLWQWQWARLVRVSTMVSPAVGAPPVCCCSIAPQHHSTPHITHHTKRSMKLHIACTAESCPAPSSAPPSAPPPRSPPLHSCSHPPSTLPYI
jgi:hypothetical protein